MYLVSLDIGQDFRLTHLYFVRRGHRYGFQRGIQRTIGQRTENATFRILIYRAEWHIRLEFTLQRTRFSNLAALHRAYHGIQDATLFQGHQHACFSVADTVSERAISAGFRIDVGQRTDTGHAVTRQYANPVYTICIRARSRCYRLRFAIAQNFQFNRLPRRQGNLLLHFVIGRHLGAIYFDDHVALRHARVTGGTDRSIRCLHIVQPNHQNAVRAHLDAYGVADGDYRCDFRRLCSNQHHQGQKQGYCDFFRFALLHFFHLRHLLCHPRRKKSL